MEPTPIVTRKIDVSIDEKEFVSNFVNAVCAEDAQLSLRHIPLRVGDHDNIFIRIKDGLILGTILNLIIPQCVDCTVLSNTPKASNEQKLENLELVLASAKLKGIDLKISAKDVLSAMYVKPIILVLISFVINLTVSY